MRLVGKLKNSAEAEQFLAHLDTLKIEGQADTATDDGCSVWIIDEHHWEQGRQELAAFVADPTYGREAPPRAKPTQSAQSASRTHSRPASIRGRRRPLVRPVVTFALIGASVAATVGINFGKHPGLIQENLSIVEITEVPGRDNYRGFSSKRDLYEVTHGQVWRLFTPALLHFGFLHLAFNMLWLYTLGTMIESRRGNWRFAILVLLIGVTSNLAQYYLKNPFNPMFGGMSGVVFGLFGYAWMIGRADPSKGIYLPPQTIVMMLFWLVLCTTGAAGPIANHAHFVGLLAGLVAANGSIALSNARDRRG